MATLDPVGKNFDITKFAKEERFGGDCIHKLALAVQAAQQLNRNIAIAHTRWGTNGEKTDINAHPHTDHKNRIAIVHNGIIENYQLLKDQLLT